MQATVLEGKVSRVDYASAAVCVLFEDREGEVSAPLPMFASEYKMPDIGDTVACLFLSNNPARGYCLGSPAKNSAVNGKGIYYKDLFGEAFIKYDSSTHILTLSAPHVVIESDTSIDGKNFLAHTHSVSGAETGGVT